jgi:hypothetical protein
MAIDLSVTMSPADLTSRMAGAAIACRLVARKADEARKALREKGVVEGARMVFATDAPDEVRKKGLYVQWRIFEEQALLKDREVLLYTARAEAFDKGIWMSVGEPGEQAIHVRDFENLFNEALASKRVDSQDSGQTVMFLPDLPPAAWFKAVEDMKFNLGVDQSSLADAYRRKILADGATDHWATRAPILG